MPAGFNVILEEVFQELYGQKRISSERLVMLLTLTNILGVMGILNDAYVTQHKSEVVSQEYLKNPYKHNISQMIFEDEEQPLKIEIANIEQKRIDIRSAAEIQPKALKPEPDKKDEPPLVSVKHNKVINLNSAIENAEKGDTRHTETPKSKQPKKPLVWNFPRVKSV